MVIAHHKILIAISVVDAEVKLRIQIVQLNKWQYGYQPTVVPSIASGRAMVHLVHRKSTLRRFVIQSSQSNLSQLICALRAASRTCWTAGRSIPIKIPMIAITTNNSTSVKPDLLRSLSLISKPFSRNVKLNLIHVPTITIQHGHSERFDIRLRLELWNKNRSSFLPVI